MKIWTRLSPPTSGSESRRLAPRQGGAELRAGPMPSLRGFPSAADLQEPQEAGGIGALLRRYPFSFSVLLPTLLVAIYLFGFATPQFISEARFVVRSVAGSSSGTDILAAVRGQGVTDSEHVIRDHLLSHDAVRALNERMELVEVFRPQHADFLSRLWWPNPSAERLLDHYRGQVSVVPDAYTGVVTMHVRTYSAEQSQRIANHLLDIGEEMVTRINQRMLNDTLRVAQEVLTRSEERLAAATTAMTGFRQRELALNPTRTAEIAVTTVGTLEAEATRLRSELQQALAFSRPDSPQVVNLRERIAAVERQILEERARLANVDQGMTRQMADFERLQLEVELAGRAVTAATQGLEMAMANMQRQQIFLQRVVEPNLAERSLYPQPVLHSFYVFAGLSLVYGLVWLLIAGVKEHVS